MRDYTSRVSNEPGWHTHDLPAEHPIRGFHRVTLLLEDASPTAAVLTDVLTNRRSCANRTKISC